jgi:glycosyltransferase involved in cell wall biosynthesis
MTLQKSTDSSTDTAPQVSVVIPTYNRAWCLPRAVESCRGSQCKVQIIVVDDGSTDETWSWLQTQRDVLSIRQPNQGQTWAANRGMAHATGQYIRFLDSDDYLCPDTIDRQLAAALSTDADVVYSRVDVREELSGKTESFGDTPQWDDFMAVTLGEGYGSHYLGMLFKRSFLGDIVRRPEFSYRDDRMFLLEVALREPRVTPVAGCAGYWIKHGSQMHTNYRGLQTTVAAWQMWKLYERILKQLESTGKLTGRRGRAAANVLWQAAHEIARTHLADAYEISLKVRQLSPGFVPPDRAAIRLLYKFFGYKNTQRVLRIRRALREVAS